MGFLAGDGAADCRSLRSFRIVMAEAGVDEPTPTATHTYTLQAPYGEDASGWRWAATPPAAAGPAESS